MTRKDKWGWKPCNVTPGRAHALETSRGDMLMCVGTFAFLGRINHPSARDYDIGVRKFTLASVDCWTLGLGMLL